MIKTILTAFIIGAITISAFAQAWHQGSGNGWYNYAEPETKEDIEDYVRPQVPPREVVMTMPPKQFQALYDDVFDYAVTYRNLDTFADYEFMRQTAMERSLEFASVMQLYNQINPEPTSMMEDRQLYDKTLAANIEDYLSKNSTEFGLLYFYTNTCAYCAKQGPLLDVFVSRSGWDVESIDIQARPALKEVFGVTSTPTIIMLDREKNTYLISNGYVKLDELQSRLYRYIRYIKGETTELTFGQLEGQQ